jgi:hypothetical protein
MEKHDERLTDTELHAFFDQLFPRGFAGADVVAALAPDGWEHSPLLACFHPSIEQRYEEALQLHRNLAALRSRRTGREPASPDDNPAAAPTLEDIRRESPAAPVQPLEELSDLVGLCLWDVFSDNHDVVAADGRTVDIGSFRGAGEFLDEHRNRGSGDRRGGDYLKFYMGTIWIGRRADLTPVYTMIFRRLRIAGADWLYHFPQLFISEFGPRPTEVEPSQSYSVSASALAELDAGKQQAEVARLRESLAEANARAREEAMDREPPATVLAYRQVYGRNPRGWPPA